MTMKERLAPFLVLLEARYMPLLLLALPQAAVVFQWQLLGRPQNEFLIILVAVFAALAFEAGYVGVIAWGETDGRNEWMWGTSLAALAFSIGVDFRVFWAVEGYWSLLHAGFPAVAFGYTMVIHQTNPKNSKVIIPTEEKTAPSVSLSERRNDTSASVSTSETTQSFVAAPSVSLSERRNDTSASVSTSETTQSFVAAALLEVPEPEMGKIRQFNREKFSELERLDANGIKAVCQGEIDLDEGHIRVLKTLAEERGVKGNTFNSWLRRGKERRKAS